MIVHHWDCDGICSAALLKAIEDGELFVPRNFFLTNNEKQILTKKEPETIYLVDIALPSEDIQFLRELAELHIFDHHKREEQEEHFHVDENAPATAVIIHDYYDLSNDLLPVLGAVGDEEEAILDTPYKETVEYVMEEYSLTFDQLLRITELLDSHYILNDFDAVKKSVDFVLRHGDDPHSILESPTLNENVKTIEHTIENGIEDHTVENAYVLCEIDTPYRIISQVTRRLFKRYPQKTVIVVNRKKGNIYVRSHNDLSPLITHAKERYCAGGKTHVCGIILPEKDINDYIETIKELTG